MDSLIHKSDQIMFTNGIYLLAASSTVLIALVYISKTFGSILQNVSNIPLDERISKMMLGGVSTAVGFYVSKFYNHAQGDIMTS